MSRTIYIYALCNPGTDVVRYVGSTENPKSRLAGHIGESHMDWARTDKAEWIRSLSAQGLRPRLLILGQTTEDRRNEDEAAWMAMFVGPDLLADPYVRAIDWEYRREGVRLGQEHSAARRRGDIDEANRLLKALCVRSAERRRISYERRREAIRQLRISAQETPQPCA
jgi:hypothetical protein